MYLSTVYLIISMIGARVRVSYLLLQILRKERDWKYSVCQRKEFTEYLLFSSSSVFVS